jgi:hypothetical protein
MHRTAYLGSLLLITILTIGSFYFPDSAAMWLASTSPAMIVARLVIGVLIVGLLASRPPRSVTFRAVLGVAAAILAGWGIQNTFSGGITFIDSLLLLHASISFALAAIESGQGRKIFVEDTSGRARRVTVRPAT